MGPGPPTEYRASNGVEASRGDERRTSHALQDDPIPNGSLLRRPDRRPGPGRCPAGDGLRRPRRPRLAERAVRRPRVARAPRLPWARRPVGSARPLPRLLRGPPARSELRAPAGLPVRVLPVRRLLLPQRLVLRPLNSDPGGTRGARAAALVATARPPGASRCDGSTTLVAFVVAFDPPGEVLRHVA